MTLRWRGTALPDLSNDEVVEALRRTLQICAALWAEIMRRKIIGRIT